MSTEFDRAINALGNTVYTLESFTTKPPATEMEAAYYLGRAGSLTLVLKDDCRKVEQVALDAVNGVTAAKDGAYRERNQVVAALARLLLSLGHNVGLGQHDPADQAWEDDWRNIVYMELPNGQVSWHIHDSELGLFEGLPPYDRAWDGHTTEEKHRRLADLGLPNDGSPQDH